SFFYKQKPAYEIGQCLEFRRVLFRSELHLRGQSADVVMRFDNLRRAAYGARFDDVGIERPLYQPLDAASIFFVFLKYAARFLVEDGNELFADDLPLLLRIGYAREFLHEAVGGVDRY